MNNRLSVPYKFQFSTLTEMRQAAEAAAKAQNNNIIIKKNKSCRNLCCHGFVQLSEKTTITNFPEPNMHSI